MIKTFTPKLAEIGKIKIGGKGEERTSKGGKKFRLPIRYDHFVITHNFKDKNGNFSPDKGIMKLLGDHPKEIKCSLLYDDIDLNFLNSFSYYHGHKCVCRGDGENAVRTISDKKTNIECLSGECEFLLNGKCKPSGLLSVTLDNAQSVGGVYKFRTHSWNSVQNILSSLALIKGKTGGVLAGLKYKLTIVKKSTEDHGNVVTVNIEFDGTEKQLNESAKSEKQKRVEYKVDMKKIELSAKTSGVLEDNDDPQDVEDEFYNPNKIITNESKSMEIDAEAFKTSADTLKPKETEKKDSGDKPMSDILG